ncbi:LysM peptidoglycan-binding domain-containing protein [Marinimicrobium agarilyticum]|uniref:LysM peptidoglycan-binding domain-containing protein n=1 Tax=Marinimicrobium agarilyticum TaxID=306546 RepID=UPI0004196CBF|nr:LysM peptidoglycan-binding domain-containing protein [Marinimicrobium agarilyticum]
MKKLMLGLLLAPLLAVWSWAEDAAFRSDHPDEYIVEKGDTLWDISNTFLNSPWLWPEIWHVNQQIENPHLIYPGDVIYLVYVDGEPRLTMDRPVKLAPGTTKLSPSVRVLPEDEAISTIPLDRVNAFLSRSRIVTDEALEAAPYMLAGPEKRLIVAEGDYAYARGDIDEDVANYGVYRREEAYTDPVTGEYLGTHAMNIGTVNTGTVEGDITKVQVLRSREELRMGDRLLPSEERTIEPNFYPSAPDDEINGLIMAVEGGVSQVGKLDVIMVNKGEREGLLVGNVLAVYKRGETTRDPVTGESVTLPDERAGLVMVFRTFEKMSLALVLEAERPLAVNDKLLNP